MKSSTLGESTSKAEIVNIDIHGVWVFVKGSEYFLAYVDYPWFKESRVSDVLNVELLHEFHLHWPALDVDLDLSTLGDIRGTPLVYK